MTATPEKVAQVARAVEAELDRGFDSWLERWSSPAGIYEDAPPPPSRHKTAPAQIARAAIEAHEAALEAAGLVIVPREPTDEMIWAYYGSPKDSGKQMWEAMLNAALEPTKDAITAQADET